MKNKETNKPVNINLGLFLFQGRVLREQRHSARLPVIPGLSPSSPQACQAVLANLADPRTRENPDRLETGGTPCPGSRLPGKRLGCPHSPGSLQVRATHLLLPQLAVSLRPGFPTVCFLWALCAPGEIGGSLGPPADGRALTRSAALSSSGSTQ